MVVFLSVSYQHENWLFIWENNVLMFGFFVVLKYSHFATKYPKTKLVLPHYFPGKSSLKGPDVSVSYLIFAPQ